MSRRKTSYSQCCKKAFKKGMHFGWNKHKKMLRDIRTGKRKIRTRKGNDHLAVIELPAPR